MVAVENDLRAIPDILEEDIGYDEPEKVELHLGELGFGTRVYDSRAAEGLNTLLKMNGYDELLDHAYLAGGLMPEFPEVYSVNNAERQRFLAQDEDVEEVDVPERVEHLIERMISDSEEDTPEHLEHYKEKWVEGKLDSRQLIEKYARKQIDTLFDDVDVDRIDYCQGEEDRFNRKELEKQWVKKFARKAREYKDKLEERVDDVEDDVERYEEKLELREEEYEALKDLKRRVSAHHTHADEPDVNNFIDQILAEQENAIFSSIEDDERRAALRDRIHRVEDYDSFETLYNDVAEEVDRWDVELTEAAEKRSALTDELDSVKNQLEQGDAITVFTKRAAISASEAEWLYKFVKDRYTKSIYNCFPDEMEDAVSPHVSWAAEIDGFEFEYETEDGETGEEVLEEGELELYGDTLVMHSTKFRSSTTSPHGLHEAKREALYRRLISKVRNETEGTVPKQILVPHGSGGFWASRVNVTGEFPVFDREEERDDPQIVSVELMPTFQSIDRLIEMKDKGVSTWNVKRADRGEHQSGAVIKARYPDNSEVYEMIDLSHLIEIGETKRDLQKHEAGTQAYQETLDELTALCSQTYKVRGLTSDWHLGDSTPPGTPTNFDRVQRTVNYLSTNYDGFADELVVGELQEGTLDHTDMEKMYYADTLPDIRDEFAGDIEALIQAGDISKEDLLGLLDDTVDMFTRQFAEVPIPQLDKQEEAVYNLLSKLVDGVQPRQVTAASGNHPRPIDEARRIERMLDDDIEVRKADSLGSTQGGQGGTKNETVHINGEIRDTNRSLGVYHRVPGGKHSSKRIWRNLLESGYMYDEVIGQHINEPMAGMVDGMEITISPAAESPGPYSESLPVPSTLYGTIIKFSNVAPEDHPANNAKRAAWHFVNDDTLEQEEYRGDKADDALNQLYNEVTGEAAA